MLYSIDEYMLDYMLKQISRIVLYSIDEYMLDYILKQISRIVFYSIDEYMLDYMLKQISRIVFYSIDEYIKDNMINSIFGRNSLCSCCYSLKPAKRILLQMLHPEKETCLSQTHKNVKPKRVSK